MLLLFYSLMYLPEIYLLYSGRFLFNDINNKNDRFEMFI